ncbi:DEAD/DEAH box helicase [Listeria booriae]|uniref:DEAD/DEAH box helicase family protein n=1 Tax=Listeria booriae TaxID=1552123 RepID=A0A841ZVQ0_9LIST|nr:DEAD/DEAH box helicase family protein [Listeria booriae]MBC1564686.1 DEAD/DEAH box helicase family protein [Listeria booriae]
MYYFEQNYDNIRYPKSNTKNTGLRNAQLGAIHAIAAFFSTRNDPALVTMPTGTGKTAVMMIAPYLLGAKKVLIVTPTKLVRSQIAEDFKSLVILKSIGVFNSEVDNPRIYELKRKYDYNKHRNFIRDCDVVVSTPQCALTISKDEEIRELFDFIIVDEAHHEPANTWRNILSNMMHSKKLLFTATPFRLDDKKIKGELIYNYPLSFAFRDGIFGEIKFIPVDIGKDEDKDIELAKVAEGVFFNDKEAGFKHCLMVRTKSRNEAQKLLSIYQRHTKLKLELVDSSKTKKAVDETILKLKTSEIDGVVCVDMMAEGFDFPNLKIAAIHTPHKTLATTLQFIGRFARTNSDKIGSAKFIAVNDEELLIENKKLFSSDAVWQDLIVNLSDEKINNDEEDKEYLKKFQSQGNTIVNEEFSLFSIRTNYHARIYRTIKFDINKTFPDIDQIIEKVLVSKSDNTIIAVTSERKLPRWSTNDGVFTDVNYNLFVIHYQEKTNLLFINSHKKNEKIYENIADAFCGKNQYEKIIKSNIHRVLSNLTGFEIFNSGLTNRISEGESYKTSAGPDVSRAIDSSSGQLYSPGHVFCKAQSADANLTIGYSSSSKIWSSAYGTVKEMILWFDINGEKITNKKAEVKTHTNYDLLPMPKEMGKIPSNIFMFNYSENSYLNPHNLFSREQHLSNDTILDIDIKIQFDSIKDNRICLKAKYGSKSYLLCRDLAGKYSTSEKDELFLKVGREKLSLTEYLNQYPLLFFTSDLEVITGREITKSSSSLSAFDLNKIKRIEWANYNTDITLEFRSSKTMDKNSIQDTIGDLLIENEDNVYVIFDHSTGEIADYIAIKLDGNCINVEFYHAKGMSSKHFNSSVGDIYEVMGQCVKSLIWIKSKASFEKKIKERQKSGHCEFKRGTLEGLADELSKNIPMRGKIIAVQPSLTSSKNIPDKIGEVLSAVNFKINNSGVANEFIIWGS